MVVVTVVLNKEFWLLDSLNKVGNSDLCPHRPSTLYTHSLSEQANSLFFSLSAVVGKLTFS